MYENIERAIRLGYKVVVVENKEKTGFYITLNMNNNSSSSITKSLNSINEDKLMSSEYTKAIIWVRKAYKDYPLVHTKTLEDGLKKLDEKILRWFSSHSSKQREILCNRISTAMLRLTEPEKNS